MQGRMLLVVLLACVSGPGCMWFNGNELPRREGPESVDTPPRVSLEIGEVKLLLNGELTSLTPSLSAEKIGSLELSQTLRIWQSRGLIKEWGKRTQLSDQPEYTLAITGSRSEESSLLAAFATGMTLYLVPSATTHHYDWQFTLTDLRTGTSYRVPVERTATKWMHLVFLPVLPLGPMGLYAGQRDQALYVYTELERQGAWNGEPTELAAPLYPSHPD